MFNDDLRAITLLCDILCFTLFAGLNGLLHLSEELETGYLSMQRPPVALSKQVKTQCFSCGYCFLLKLVNKIPVQYPLVRSMQRPNPRQMLANKQPCVNKMKRATQTLVVL